MYKIVLFLVLVIGLVACSSEQSNSTKTPNPTVNTNAPENSSEQPKEVSGTKIELSNSPLLQKIQLVSNTASLEDLLAEKGETTSLCKEEDSKAIWDNFELKDSCVDVAYHLTGRYTYVLIKKPLPAATYATALFVFDEKGKLLDHLDVAGKYEIKNEVRDQKGKKYQRVVNVVITTQYDVTQEQFRVQTSSRSEIVETKQVDKKMEMVSYVFNRKENKFQFMD